MDLKELVPSLDTKKRYNCIYTPGYIDKLGELGFLQNLQHKDQKYITCGMQFMLGPQQYISTVTVNIEASQQYQAKMSSEGISRAMSLWHSIIWQYKNAMANCSRQVLRGSGVWFDHNNLQRLQQVNEEIQTTEFPMNDVIGILMASKMPNQSGDFVQLQHNLNELARVDNPLFQHAMNIGSLSVLQNRLQMPSRRY